MKIPDLGGSMLKIVTIYSKPSDPVCTRVEKFLSEQDIVLKVHNVKTHPLSFGQISTLLRHFSLEHFYNPYGSGRKQGSQKIDFASLDRRMVFEQLAADNNLLHLPIIVAGRLMTVGDDFDRIRIMLQIKSNGSDPKPQSEK
jgi:arsenate reductase-like glutaredoxin family protein